MKTLFLLLACLVIGSCAEKPTENVGGSNPIPEGKRNYQWTIDSVAAEDQFRQREFMSIWGSAPNDIWAAGYTADAFDCLWHYDGVCWRRATTGTPIRQGTGYKIVGRVWGTARNDVWAIGGRIIGTNPSNPDQYNLAPFVMHFNGFEWREVTAATPAQYAQMPLGCLDILGTGKDDFWVGRSEAVHHYKNGVWKKYDLSHPGHQPNGVAFVREHNGEIYVQTWQPNSEYNDSLGTLIDGRWERLYKLTRDGIRGSRFVLIDETIQRDIADGKFGTYGLWFHGNKIHTSSVFRVITNVLQDAGNWDTTAWRTELQSPTPQAFGRAFVHSPKNTFVIGSKGVCAHFNGRDWQFIPISVPQHDFPSPMLLQSIWMSDSVVVIGDIYNGTVYRGF